MKKHANIFMNSKEMHYFSYFTEFLLEDVCVCFILTLVVDCMDLFLDTFTYPPHPL